LTLAVDLAHLKQRMSALAYSDLLVEDALERCFTAPDPVDGPAYGLFLHIERRLHVRAVVKADHHVAAIAQLQLDGFLRRELELAVGPLHAKGDAPLAHLAVPGVLPDQR